MYLLRFACGCSLLMCDGNQDGRRYSCMTSTAVVQAMGGLLLVSVAGVNGDVMITGLVVVVVVTVVVH